LHYVLQAHRDPEERFCVIRVIDAELILPEGRMQMQGQMHVRL